MKILMVSNFCINGIVSSAGDGIDMILNDSWSLNFKLEFDP